MAMRTINVHRTRTGVRRRLREFLDRGNGIAPYFMVMPVLLIILLVAVYPIIDSILLSLLDNPLLNSGTEFVGLRNYLQLLHDSVFEAAIGTTIFFSIATVALETVFGFGIALLINGTFPGRGLVRAVILIPWAFPTIVSAQIWSLMFNDRRGIITSILQLLHLLVPGDTLLRTAPGIMTAAIITDVWKTTPFMAILILAGLQVIPGELYEAAEVDGGNRWQRFRSITLPMLTGPLLIALLFRTLDAFRVFDLFYILAGRQVLTLSSYAYYYMFSGSGNDFSIGVAAAVILFAGGLCISLVYVLLLRLMRR